jgi:lysophospholipase L1-like esterase
MVRPVQTLGFVIAVCTVVFGLCFLFAGEIRLFSCVTLYIPSPPQPENTFHENKTQVLDIIRKADEEDKKENFHASGSSTDSSFLSHSERNNPESDTLFARQLHYSNPEALHTLFRAFKDEVQYQPVHILHYGDSQIESDRISDYLRMKLQMKFGGKGQGLIGLKPLTQGISCKVFSGDEWQRHVTFLGKNKDVPHNCFGPAGILYRFTPYSLRPDSMPLTTARVSWQVNTLAGPTIKGYNRVRIFYGGGKTKTWLEFYENGILSHADSLLFGNCTLVKDIDVRDDATQHEIRFYSRYSPDFYGISLESTHGVYVDNIAQRGSSGTFFHLISPEQFRYYYKLMNVKAVLLQFGGNALPNLHNEEEVKNYASYIRGQLALLRKITPDATVIFIGPADMGIKDKDAFVTHPLLELLRDELKKVVLSSGMVYFDLYACMGGKNSMSVWVKEKLAADDYIHFSPQGARKIAVMLYSALITEYQKWNKHAVKK